jgi:hypothetical protein
VADQKISAMGAASTPLTGAELVPLVQSGVNVRTTVALFGQYAKNTLFNYGSFEDSTSQTGSPTAPTAFTFNTTDLSSGVTLALTTRVTATNAGVYNFQWSGQFQNLDQFPQDVSVWIRVNGTDVVGSTGLVGIPGRKSAGVPSHILVGWNYFVTLTAGQYIELMWVPTIATLTVPAYPAQVGPPAIPAAASVIVTMNQVG